MKDYNHKPYAGTVISFNISPRGAYEGLLLRTEEKDETIQFNFPPEAAGTVAHAAGVGDPVRVTALGEHDDDRPHGHPVLELFAINGPGGRTVEPADPDRAKPAHIMGTVKQINYARHGEPNGAILDGGEFVHMKPHGAKAVHLKVGQKLDVRGHARSMLVAGMLVEAELVNDIEIDDYSKEDHDEKHDPNKQKHAEREPAFLRSRFALTPPESRHETLA